MRSLPWFALPNSAHHLVCSPFPSHVSQLLGSHIKVSLTSTLLGLLCPICTHLVRSPFPHRFYMAAG